MHCSLGPSCTCAVPSLFFKVAEFYNVTASLVLEIMTTLYSNNSNVSQ